MFGVLLSVGVGVDSIVAFSVYDAVCSAGDGVDIAIDACGVTGV